ncbi:MAG: hypothetical protein L6R30_13260 [Thermoanaerobaculia bacterium]|nr:hypothetical protein [Thermoanaerobaculia bacterium]
MNGRRFLVPNERSSRVAVLAALLIVPGTPILQGAPGAYQSARIERSVEKLPAGFSPAPPESFFWTLPGAKDQPEGAPAAAPGTYGFSIGLKASAPSSTPCTWMVSSDASGKTVRVKMTAPPPGDSLCLALNRQIRKRPVTEPSGTKVIVDEIYDKGVALKPADATELAFLKAALGGQGLVIDLERPDAADAARLAKGGLGAIAVFDADGKPEFDMEDKKPEPGATSWTRRNIYQVSGAKAEVWLYDKKSGAILLKKALHP